jgi:hypothetical protein
MALVWLTLRLVPDVSLSPLPCRMGTGVYAICSMRGAVAAAGWLEIRSGHPSKLRGIQNLERAHRVNDPLPSHLASVEWS